MLTGIEDSAGTVAEAGVGVNRRECDEVVNDTGTEWGL